jgi:hypothetical protein
MQPDGVTLRKTNKNRLTTAMLTLLKAEEILKIGLTCTQVFYLVGAKLNRGMCRFVKTDSIHTAIATLLAIKGKRARVEDIRLTDAGGLNVFTDAGTEYIASAESRVFLTRYNQLALNGCNSECNCASNPDDVWKQFCVHRIAEHLTSLKEKVQAVAQVVEEVAAKPTMQVQRLLNEVFYYVKQDPSLVAFPSKENGNYTIRLCLTNKTVLGLLIITKEGGIKILSAVPMSEVQVARSINNAIARLKDAMPTSKPKEYFVRLQFPNQEKTHP